MSKNGKLTTSEAIVKVAEQMKSIEYKIDELKYDVSEIRQHYVRKEEFNIVRNVVYGMVGLILSAFFATLAIVVGWG